MHGKRATRWTGHWVGLIAPITCCLNTSAVMKWLVSGLGIVSKPRNVGQWSHHLLGSRSVGSDLGELFAVDEFRTGRRASFENREAAHARRPAPFSLPSEKFPRTRARPTYLSRIPHNTDVTAAHYGAHMLGLPLTKQGWITCRVLESLNAGGHPLYPETVVLMPRRASKTTAIWSLLIGRCTLRPDYMVVVSAQDGTRARNLFRTYANKLLRAGWARKADRPPLEAPDAILTVRAANGSERMIWDNGSELWVVPPKAEAFRSDAADCIYLDEAGEYSMETGENLLAGALPLMDTRPDGQAIISGTPSPIRAGLFWDRLKVARLDPRRSGIVDYSALDHELSVTFPDGEDGPPQLNEDLLRRVHPGIGTLTTMARMRERFAGMSLSKFESEYLCRFPYDSTVSAVHPDRWAEAETPMIDKPKRIGLAFDCSPDSSSAAIAVAWRDASGTAFIEVVACRPATSWVAQKAASIARQYRTPIGWDVIGANHNPGDQLARMRPPVKTQLLNLRDIQGAAARLTQGLDEGTVKHFGQADLTAAALGAVWRNISEGGRAFGRKASSADVSPLVAASEALWLYDRGRDRAPLRLSV